MTNADLVSNRATPPPGGWSCASGACPNGELSPLRDSCQTFPGPPAPDTWAIRPNDTQPRWVSVIVVNGAM